MIYCDNAATTFPKPPAVARAMAEHLATEAVNPGRAGFDLSQQAAARLEDLRRNLGAFFGNPDPDPRRTIFTGNATAALNLAMQGLCRPGDHVVADVLSHNSVLRPLHMMRARGTITFDLVPCDARGFITPEAVDRCLKPATRLVILNHASNVTGAIQPAGRIGALCRDRGVLFLLDVAQTAGALPVNMADDALDMVAFTGHKGLLGPTGTGGLILGPGAEPESSLWGGTGVRSAELFQPRQLPYRLEAGTLNAVGLIGLAAGLAFLEGEGVTAIGRGERALADAFAEGCRDMSGLRILGRGIGDEEHHLGIVSLVCEGMDPEKIGLFLDAQWDIAVRTGLHCAPLAHQALGTGTTGAVRFSFGPFNQEDQLPRLHEALWAVTRGS